MNTDSTSLPPTPPFRFHNIIGSHPLMLHLYELIGLVAPTDVTVHIYGESGVGKELAADAIHHLSPRHSARFVKLNCSSIPSTLLESSLFGHVRGAFTDARRDAQGFVEYAQGGTIFLDEIGEISQEMQVKLLRLLQSHEYCRVGETVSRRADIRIITATNRDLEELVKRRVIREDFYYRINIFPITIPPLRSRISDISDLTRFFIEKFNTRFSKQITGISPAVEQRFKSYHWPGNVRELENALEHAFVVASGGEIEIKHLPETLKGAPSLSPQIHLERGHGRHNLEDERKAIVEALQHSNGRRVEAAKILGMSRVTLWKKIQKYGLNSSESNGVNNENI